MYTLKYKALLKYENDVDHNRANLDNTKTNFDN